MSRDPLNYISSNIKGFFKGLIGVSGSDDLSKILLDDFQKSTITSPEGFMGVSKSESAKTKGAGKLGLTNTENALQKMEFTPKSMKAFENLLNSNQKTVRNSINTSFRTTSANSAVRRTIQLEGFSEVPLPTPSPAPRKREIS